MDFERILAKKKKLEQNQIDTDMLHAYEEKFEQKFIYDSCALEGNSLTFEEVKKILKSISNE